MSESIFPQESGETIPAQEQPPINDFVTDWALPPHGGTQAAGMNHYAGDVPWSHGGVIEPNYPPIGHDSGPEVVYVPKKTEVVVSPWVSEKRLREIFEEALLKVFGPIDHAGVVDARHFARVSIEMDTGETWGGVVYPKEKTE